MLCPPSLRARLTADRSNISPLISEQYRDDRPYIKTLKSGERVIVDPAATIARIYMYFYMMINIGALTGQISMVYAERYVGFYMSFLLPTIMFCFSPLILFVCRKRYYRVPPTGSVYTQAYRLWKLAMRGRWSFNPVKLYVGLSHSFWLPANRLQTQGNHVGGRFLATGQADCAGQRQAAVDELR